MPPAPAPDPLLDDPARDAVPPCVPSYRIFPDDPFVLPRVATYAGAMARAMELRDAARIVKAATVCDIGKHQVPRAILDKPGALTTDELALVRKHPELGARFLARCTGMEALAPLVRAHHERWDGQGYPDGLRGEAIPLGARIIAVADVFDAMTSDRPHRRRLGLAEAIAEIERDAGRAFDPVVVDAFLRVAHAI